MSERVFPSGTDAPAGFPNWSAIWAGVFTFVAIWSVFGLLGTAIFASVANPINAVAGMGLGMEIWTVVLMIIAMFVAGRTAGGLSGRIDGLMTGTITFGLSMMAALVIAFLARLGLGLFAGLGWTGFIASILGWVGAIGGAYSVTQRRAVGTSSEQRIGRAA